MSRSSRSLPSVLTRTSRADFPVAVRRSRWPLLVLALLILVLVAATITGLRYAASRPSRVAVAKGAMARIGSDIPPPDEPIPVVEPLALQPLAPDGARAINAAVPFSTTTNPAARAFRGVGTPEDLARATDCLAAAMLYEAGDDPVGQRAVAQIVLNRVRHPAFPHSVCGVVFQGSEKTTGCQFTFTCDGSLARHRPRPASWLRAQILAGAALGGRVFAPVGLSTHYHTDWVVPYWSSSLDKVTAIESHLFFRWTGWWGTSRAFYITYNGAEPVIGAMALLSDAHRLTLTGLANGAVEADGAIAALPAGGVEDPVAALPHFSPTPSNPNVFLAALDAVTDPDRYTEIAAAACGARSRCLFMGWTNARDVPAALPASTSQLEGMAFHYLRDPAFGAARVRWDCSRLRRADPAQCLSHQAVSPADRGVRDQPAPDPAKASSSKP